MPKSMPNSKKKSKGKGLVGGQKKLDKKILDEISDEIILVDGVFETLKELSDSGITLYVCSGSINYIISMIQFMSTIEMFI